MCQRAYAWRPDLATPGGCTGPGPGFANRLARLPWPPDPFFRSHPSLPLLLAALSVVTVGAVLPTTPLAQTLGFQPLPGLFYFALALMVASYLVLIEIGKRWFYRIEPPVPTSRERTLYHRLLRRAAASPPPAPAQTRPAAMKPTTAFLALKDPGHRRRNARRGTVRTRDTPTVPLGLVRCRAVAACLFCDDIGSYPVSCVPAG